ncbi:hypothetical protein [Pandoraea pnomenusa]|uniref:hypothetical protein n=1 Tax=Pandoraea pnomenusa TaxID=93220 RepID=UPI000B2BF80D|nr:hypothetical protein [Pandoraea pnomenusa]
MTTSKPTVAAMPKPVPSNSVWTRHQSGDTEWWSYGRWQARKRVNKWVLTYGNEEIMRHEYLTAVMRRASEPNTTPQATEERKS